MNGLLEFAKTPEGQGLLSAAFGGMAGARRGQPLNSIGRGGLAGLAGYANAQDRELQIAENAKQNEIRGLQVDMYKQNLAAAQKKTADEARQRELIASQFAPVTGANANAATGISGPRIEAANAIGQTPTPNYQLLIANGVPPELVKSLAESQNLGRAKVARTVKGMGADGREMEYQVDEYGQRVGDGLAQYRAPIQADTGGAVQFLDPYTQKPLSSLTKSMSPDAKASNALGWANHGLSKERLGVEKQNASANGFTFNADFGGYVPKAPGGQFIPLNGLPAGSKNGQASEGERKAATLLARMDGSLKQMQSALKESPDSAKPGIVAEAFRRAPFGGGDTAANLVTPETRQQVEAAQLDILDAALTLGTGAAYTKEQLEGYRRSYFPQIGDSPKTVSDKQDRLNNVLGAARIAAGRAAPTQSAAAPPAKPSGDPLSGFRIIEVAK